MDKPVTQEEIVEALRELSGVVLELGSLSEELEDLDWRHERRECSKLIDRIQSEGIAPPEGFVLVPIEDCERCDDNNGCVHSADGMDFNCECFYVPQSRYNQKKAMLNAAKDSP